MRGSFPSFIIAPTSLDVSTQYHSTISLCDTVIINPIIFGPDRILLYWSSTCIVGAIRVSSYDTEILLLSNIANREMLCLQKTPAILKTPPRL